MKRLKGFTLVELVIVIAIVIILSVVSVPIYRGYTRNAKMAEAYALFGTILSSQKAYYSQYGNFLGVGQTSAGAKFYTCNEEVLGIDARGNKYFTWFALGGTINATLKEQFVASAYKPEELGATPDKPCVQFRYSINDGTTFLDGSGTFSGAAPN